MAEQQDYAIIIDRGLVRVYVGDEDGRQATAFYIHRGELMSRGIVRRPALKLYIQAVTDVEVPSWMSTCCAGWLAATSR